MAGRVWREIGPNICGRLAPKYVVLVGGRPPEQMGGGRLTHKRSGKWEIETPAIQIYVDSYYHSSF